MTTLLVLTAVVAAARGLWSPCGLSMLSSLNPVAERGRGHRFWITALWYLAGAMAGGAVLGAGLAAGAYLAAWAGWSAAVTGALALAGAIVAIASDLRVGGWSLPDHPRQVDERWLTAYRRWIYAGGYGAQIGAGFATYVMTAGVYLLAWLAVLTGRPAVAFGAGLLFGLVRGSSIALAALARDPARLLGLMGRVEAAAGRSLAAAVAAHVVVGAGAVWLLAGRSPADPTTAGLATAGVAALALAWLIAGSTGHSGPPSRPLGPTADLRPGRRGKGP